MAFKLKNVLILDGVDPVCEQKLIQAGILVTSRTKLTKEDLVQEIKQHDGLIVRSATKVTAEILDCPHTLKVIGRAGTGVDNIDVEAATKRGVLVMNTPGGNTLSAAEQTCALICSLSRSIPQACASLKLGAWDRKKFLGNELSEKTLGVIGLGRIGREVCDRMRSFGMKTIGYDPLVSPEVAASWGIEYYPLEEIWPKADYITVHVPLIPQTRYLINATTLKKCKPSVKIVNVARGGVVEEKALLEAMNSGTCAGAALDVFEEEPPKDLSLLQHPKVICTPHLGANTVEAQKRVAVEIADQFVAMCQGKRMAGVVNAPALMEVGAIPTSQTWMNLATSLGKVASQMLKVVEGTRINVTLNGNVIGGLSKLVVPAILEGFLQPLHNLANIVSAELLGKESNVEINVKSNPATANCMEIEVQNGSQKYSFIGTISGEDSLLFNVNGCLITPGVTLTKHLLFFQVSSPDIALGSVATAIKETPILAILSSSFSSNEGWIVARTQNKVDNIGKVDGANLKASLSF